MKNAKYLAVGLLSMILSAKAVYAHHEPVKELVEQAEILYQAVNNSFLNYRVKTTVYSFLTESNHLDVCVDKNPAPVGGPVVSAACQPQLKLVRTAFDGVNYYLFDATDIPSVHQPYLTTRDALYNVN